MIGGEKKLSKCSMLGDISGGKLKILKMFHALRYIGWEIENFENVPRSEIYRVGN